MKTVKFNYDTERGYTCSEPGEQSGEYVRADYARFLEIKCFELAARVRCEQEIGGQIAMFE